MKQGRLPKKPMVIRDLKRGPVKVETKEGIRWMCLVNAMIPDRFMAETNPNDPLELNEIHAWNIDDQKWDKFKISELEKYEPQVVYPGKEDEQERREDDEDSGRVGNQTPEASQET